jgi:hypothetical protein
LLGAPNQGESDDKPSASIALRREKRQDIYPVEQKSMQGNAASVQRHFSESKTPRRSPLGDPHPPYSYKAGIGADVGVGQAKPLLFQGCLPRNALILIFPIEMVALRRHWLSKTIQTVRHKNLAMLCSEAEFIFHLLNKFLAADPDRLRPAIVSSCNVSARSCFDPPMRVLEL